MVVYSRGGMISVLHITSISVVHQIYKARWCIRTLLTVKAQLICVQSSQVWNFASKYKKFLFGSDRGPPTLPLFTRIPTIRKYKAVHCTRVSGSSVGFLHTPVLYSPKSNKLRITLL